VSWNSAFEREFRKPGIPEYWSGIPESCFGIPPARVRDSLSRGVSCSAAGKYVVLDEPPHRHRHARMTTKALHRNRPTPREAANPVRNGVCPDFLSPKVLGSLFRNGGCPDYGSLSQTVQLGCCLFGPVETPPPPSPTRLVSIRYASRRGLRLQRAVTRDCSYTKLQSARNRPVLMAGRPGPSLADLQSQTFCYSLPLLSLLTGLQSGRL
jgi:hypothetical protein